MTSDLFVFQVVKAKDVMGCTRGVLVYKFWIDEGKEKEETHQTICLPLGIALTAVTGPLPCGNLKARSGSRRPL